jgi:hypothetical protein
MRKTLAAIATLGLLLAALGLAAGPANADDLSFGIGYKIRRGAPGTTVDIGGTDVPASLQGRTCDVSLMTENNESIHPGNDVIITSDGSVTFRNVESQVEAKTYPGQPLTLGSTIDADLRFGRNGVTSSGFQIMVDCPPPPTTTVPPTTTTEPPVTTTTEPPVTVPPTTAKPPVTEPPTVIILPPAKPAPPVPAEPTFTG